MRHSHILTHHILSVHVHKCKGAMECIQYVCYEDAVLCYIMQCYVELHVS